MQSASANDNSTILSFLDLAALVLGTEKQPMTADEIWSYAQTSGLAGRLQTKGKTPSASLGAMLYTSVKKADSPFEKIGARPARFLLKVQTQVPPMPPPDATEPHYSIPPTKYKEFDLHPVLVYFAAETFGVHCKTIFHERSIRRGEKQNQWLHPDVVGFSLITSEWEDSVVQLAQSTGSSAARLYSFELKTSLEFGTLREYFFQAVSNSSWAHEGYLVAVNIDEDIEFRAELKRLSQSFGIGVIQLDVDLPVDSQILYAARDRSEVDWETVNRIAELNSDFNEFIRSATNSVRINQAAIDGFDKLHSEEEINAYVKKLKAQKGVEHGFESVA